MGAVMETTQKGTLHPATFSEKFQIEHSVHTCPKTCREEMGIVYADLKKEDEVLVIPTFQPSKVDLSSWGNEQAVEKDRLLEQFMLWANAVRDRLLVDNYWADFTDPASGYPVHSQRWNDVQRCGPVLDVC